MIWEIRKDFGVTVFVENFFSNGVVVGRSCLGASLYVVFVLYVASDLSKTFRYDTYRKFSLYPTLLNPSISLPISLLNQRNREESKLKQNFIQSYSSSSSSILLSSSTLESPSDSVNESALLSSDSS